MRNWNSHLLGRFATRCIEDGNRSALTDGQRTVTYAELDAAADDLAAGLQAAGVAPGDLVCVVGQRSADFPVAALAAWRCGAAYVPVAGDTPPQRIDAILAQAHCSAGIALDDSAADAWSANPHRPALHRPRWEHAGRHPRPREPQREDVAYVIFTSGSTGEPKGVIIGHDSLADMMESYCAHFAITGEDRVSAVANIAFDASVIEFWPALSSGATVFVAAPEIVRSPPSLLRWMDAHAITYSWLPTPLAEVLIADEHLLLPQTLRMIETAGQRLHTRPRGWRIPLANSYGPTETTVIATSSRVADANDASRQGDAPDIGRPLSGVTTHLLDETMKPVGQGDVGQLHIGGIGVGRGYWGRPDLTAQHFLPDPFSAIQGARLYATGDLCRINAHGDLEFIGRVDHQVKLRGHRIELGEVEVALTRVDGIGQAACAVVELHGAQRLLACYTVRAGSEVDRDVVRAQLASTLPDYMLPDSWVEVDQLPLTANGKVDRARLPMPVDDGLTAPVAGLGDKERAFLDWYRTAFGLPIGWKQDLFHAGGSSIDAILLIDDLRRSHGVHVEYPDFVSDSTPFATYVRLRDDIPTSSAHVAIGEHADATLAPLSVSQRAVWFLANMAPEDRAYHAKARLVFQGEVCVHTMRLALQDIVDRHGIYRTSFFDDDGAAIQRVHPPFHVELMQTDLRDVVPADATEAQVGDALDDLLLGAMNAPFSLDRLPLVRWSLVRLPKGLTALLHIEHHLVHDGWSHNLFVRELLEHYARRIEVPNASAQAPMPLQYADFCITQDAWLSTPAAARSEAYWREMLQEAPASINLPVNGERDATGGQTIRMLFPRHRWQRIEAFCRTAGYTPFAFVLSAFGYVLSRASGDEDLCIGSAFANRSWAGASEIIGMMINTVVLRCRLQRDDRVYDLLTRSSEVCNGAQAHQAFPFERLVQVLNPPREPGVNPLFQVFLGFHDSPLPSLSMPGVDAIGLKEAIDSQSSKFDLSLVVIPRHGQEGGGDPVHMLWEFKHSRFAPWFVESLIAAFDRTVDVFLDTPDAPLQAVQVAPAPLPRSYSTPASETVVGRILTRAHEMPDAVAIEFGGHTLCYAALATSIRTKAAALHARGAGQGDLVGVCLGRSPDLVAWLLAVQWVGSAYVPLDPDYPVERLRYIVDHSSPHCVVGDDACLAFVDADRRMAPDSGGDDEGGLAGPDAKAPAYVIYTSGSTGQPKGVSVGHDNLSSFIDAMAALFPLQPNARWVAVTSCSFDISILEFFLPLMLGARVVLADEGDVRDAGRLATLLAHSGADHLQATPSTWRALMETDWIPPDGFVGLCGGEAMDVALARQCLARGMRLYNLYGPTEGTVWSCVHAVTDADNPVPIGMPLENTEVHVLDRHRRPLPRGAIGELWIGGRGVARGYLHAPDQTAERFIVHPFGGEGRLYATGDLVSADADGQLHFHGRNDHQVKIRGFRIELAEVEARIREIDGVVETVVVAHGHGAEPALVAYFVIAGDEVATHDVLSPGAMARHCTRSLPAYMVPAYWIPMASLPLMPNGKIDRAALPVPGHTRVATARSPSSVSERAVALIYADLLGIADPNVGDAFLANGGHSLLAMRAVARINREFGIRMSVVDFLGLSTIESIAGSIDRMRPGTGSRYIEEIIL